MRAGGIWAFTIYFGCLIFGITDTANGQTFKCPNETISACYTPSATCMSISSPVLLLNDTTIQDYIVSLHNIRRSKVAAGGETLGSPGPQPPSTCMGTLKWNSELATSAQNWANQCKLAGDTGNRNLNRTTDSYVGQNAYGFIDPLNTPALAFPLPFYWEQAIQSWYGEVANFNNKNVANYTYMSSVGHYTQVVWGRTVSIGCGFKKWQLNDGSNRFARILVCNYWPGGNKIGTPVYNSSQSICDETCYPSAASNSFSNETVLNGFLCDVPPK